VLRRQSGRAEVGERERVSGRVGQHHVLGDSQVGIDVDQGARLQEPPRRIVIHRFTGEHDARVDTIGGRERAWMREVCRSKPAACPGVRRSSRYSSLGSG
jgi:hypothetical protein